MLLLRNVSLVHEQPDFVDKVDHHDRIEDVLRNPSFLIHNSSFLPHNFSFLIQNSLLLIQNSSCLLTVAYERAATDGLISSAAMK